MSYDAIIVGGGHNGLVTAAYLARAGKRVLVLERRERVGGAAVSDQIIPGLRFAGRGACRIDGENNRFTFARVKPDQLPNLDLEVGLLPRLSCRRMLNTLPPFDEAGWEAPLARLAGARSAFAQENAAVAGN